MKNKIGLLIGGVAIIALIAAVIFFGSKAPAPVANKDQTKQHGAAENSTPSPTASTSSLPEVSEEPVRETPPLGIVPATPDGPALSPPIDSPAPDISPTPGNEPYNAIGDRKDIPILDVPVAQADLTASVFSPDNVAEEKYLSAVQKEELAETGLSPNKQIEPKDYIRGYAVEWSKTDDTGWFDPQLPEQVPLYAVSRPKDAQVFETAKQTADNFGIGGTTLRTNANTYSTFDVKTGDLKMEYNFYKNTFEIPRVEVAVGTPEQDMPEKVKLDSANALEWYLYGKGLLRFPYHGVFADTDDGGKVVRFEPDLELQIVHLDSAHAQGDEIGLKGDDESLIIGIGDSVDARLDHDKKLRELYAFFPNLEKWGDVKLPGKEEILKMILAGAFSYGGTELQYPGALTLEERQEFYDLAAGDNVRITEAQLNDVECGYFQEPEGNYQLFYQPVCIAYGQGLVGSYDTLFGVVLSLAK